MSDIFEKTCPFCDTNVKRTDGGKIDVRPQYKPSFTFYNYPCPTCGSFKIEKYALSRMEDQNFAASEKKAAISAYTRQCAIDHSLALLMTRGDTHTFLLNALSQSHQDLAYLEDIVTDWPPSVSDRLDRTLKNLAKLAQYPGDAPTVTVTTDYPLGYCENSSAFTYLLDQLRNSKLIDYHNPQQLISVTPVVSPADWNRIAELQRGQAGERPHQAFIAMWFDDEVKPAYEDGIKPGIETAGYDPLRIGAKDHVGRIDDEIIAEIRRSRFVVADFTGHRGGVYYEAGFASALGLPVVYTCRKDHMKYLHFDIRQYNTIDWETPEELRDRLARRIIAVIGLPPSNA